MIVKRKTPSSGHLMKVDWIQGDVSINCLLFQLTWFHLWFL